ncbi:sensor domain-containing diguanylate cyclase [Nisaea sp.]|uniref:sensor domain-containing diguanylate cyclase n=1 Tax=Nisaea sp. TaxID=2024842 RepID=UPI002B26ABCC|nr:sensor domain-containing diguanylate cyclase [Nisaea sp.]
MTFRLQIVLLAAILLITAIGTTTVVFVRISAKELTHEIGHSMAVLATEMSDRLDREMAIRLSEVRILAGLPTISEMRRTDSIQNLIDSLKDEVSAFTWVGILDTKGTVIAATDGILVGKNISQRPVYTEARKDTFIGDVHDAVLLAALLPNPTGEAMKFVDISQPVFDESGALQGIFAAHLSWRWATDVADTLLTFNASERMVEIFVVARDGTILLSPVPELIGHAMDLESVAAARRGLTGWAVEAWPDGRDYVTGYTATDGEGSYPGLGWSVLTRAPAKDILQPVSDVIAAMIAAAVLILLAACVLAMILASRLVRPLQAMTDAVESMRTERGRSFPDIPGPREVQTLCRAFQSLLSALISTERQAEYLQDRANTDPLTGLANRAGLDAFFAERAGLTSPFAVLAIDLDDFKPINDTYGHDAGDAVLRQIAERLKGMFRSSDIIARSGGDEFLAVIAIPDSEDGTTAERIAKRLIDAISAPIQIVQRTGDPVTVSIGASVGLSSYPRDGTDRASVSKAADSALYAAKRAGKRRFVAASENPAVAAD